MRPPPSLSGSFEKGKGGKRKENKKYRMNVLIHCQKWKNAKKELR
jgi:hypothetical protein